MTTTTNSVLAEIETPYNRLRVVERGPWTDIEVAGATFSTYHKEQILSGYSWDAIAAGALLGLERPKRVLMLGLGGGTAFRILRHVLGDDVELIGVEIDAGLIDLARAYLHLDDIKVETRIEDGISFLRQDPRTFDVIIDELFLAGETDVYRSHVPEGEIQDLFVSKLSSEGILVANLITDYGHMEMTNKVRDAFQSRFSSCARVIPPKGLNEIVVGGASVAGFGRLKGFVSRFSLARDQALWQSLQVVPVVSRDRV